MSSADLTRERRSASLKANRITDGSVKHGVFPFLKSGVHPCNKCVKRNGCDRFEENADCSYLADYQEKIIDSVMDLDIVGEQDRPMAHLLSKDMAVIALCEMYFAVEGLVIHDKRKKSLNAQPLVATYNEAKRQARQTMQALGLGPAARTKINLENVNVVKQMGELGMKTTDEQEGLEFLDD
ncbi:P27 family phage terminase small subunit [Brevibacillus laterosporus]|uniref:P27 family phage terminase small subunit n=1 Tax=Brevibacillus laterosporus TaxID=1465 RepID=UPI001443BCC6|nr:P27 family phage terminase small subunit [Brevibacillus laterosporus]MCR8939759.1 P27 family phage terminase small subunit [Brevibacillus laterosporus]MCZ0842399.1 P27 family phage terminase small subunit [Brevibacillus laterosporus]MCZ0846396.1 P27 family phage terminase small subunit [Brevibacillus laterosporus]MDN9012395.1 P27 family phage terminase small subunit [Brevibacillus laterosporus]MDO0943542.1 P27 family phage terminase small subunit [Brevibacillus laterosporus]